MVRINNLEVPFFSIFFVALLYNKGNSGYLRKSIIFARVENREGKHHFVKSMKLLFHVGTAYKPNR